MIKEGDLVKLIYTAKFDDGEVFDSASHDEPLELTLGEGEHLKYFEDALIGLKVGDEKIINIACEDAYGLYDDELVLIVKRTELPEEINGDIEIGMMLEIPDEENPEEEGFPVTVVELDAETVTLDGNDPLAGHDLTFEIKIVAIN